MKRGAVGRNLDRALRALNDRLAGVDPVVAARFTARIAREQVRRLMVGASHADGDERRAHLIGIASCRGLRLETELADPAGDRTKRAPGEIDQAAIVFVAVG
ncbi:MAG: hypothetical protein OEW21_19730, partial [Betaproteobacteria bacterium]|nr:hypothetical protein [Betaproteobacteria bacterium]